MCRNLTKNHLAGYAGSRPNMDPHYQPVSLQTWTQSAETRAYWVIQNSLAHSRPVSDTNRQRNLLPDGNLAFLQEVKARDAHYHTTQEREELLTSTGTTQYEGTRPWLERTGWITTYQGVPRAVLRRMVLPPSRGSVIHGLSLGSYQSQQLASPAGDEEHIAHLLSALDLVLDRCEETLQHTGIFWSGYRAITWHGHILARAAAGDTQHGLMYQGTWKGEVVHQYLQYHEQLLEYIAGILITTGGQMPRLKELLGIE
ncbi:hypothetical protein CNMCM5793_007812 [Aspergillus hiratsukae]|uniref:Uncharacterized protein n=1 Tax=Aspergillus hiratsukae TaxID=1194566 RepID=A0A8H6QKE8_9EURO|nr:hypothetical protein CNMCM5793_007812 [Aspergillus hiratsukae]KAF7174429.1 hypothetical protein CNMCM6106_008737 [Aspergillus hiratsukae]